MARQPLPVSSNLQPDPKVLATLYILYRVIFVAIPLFSLFTLLVWSVPALRGFLPYHWDAVKADTAICLLLGSLSLWLSLPMQSETAVRVSRILAAMVLSVALLSWLAIFTAGRLTLAGGLSYIPNFQTIDRMSPNTSAVMLLFGVLLLLLRERKNLYSRIADSAAIVLIFLMVVIVSGAFFGAIRLFGPSAANHMSTPTMLSLCALSFVAFSRRAEYGGFSLFLSDSIASRIIRISAPFALILPFVVGVMRAVLSDGLLSPEYSNAIATATVSLMAFVLIFILSRRIQRLEQEIRVLSLNDELTGLYNRRGFYLLAAQSYALAQRSSNVFSILFIDVDSLKQVNDTHGHEEGSALLQEISRLLLQCFRETDVVGRLGGDEFSVAARATQQEIATAAQRLQAAVDIANAAAQASADYNTRRYRLSFSWGFASAGPGSTITLEALLQQADVSMYEAKRAKKRQATEAEMAVTV